MGIRPILACTLLCLVLSPSVLAETCTDTPPDKKYTCAQQKSFEKCDSKWMISNGFCNETCGRCTSPAPAPKAEAPVAKPAPSAKTQPATEVPAAVVPRKPAAAVVEAAPVPATEPKAEPKAAAATAVAKTPAAPVVEEAIAPSAEGPARRAASPVTRSRVAVAPAPEEEGPEASWVLDSAPEAEPTGVVSKPAKAVAAPVPSPEVPEEPPRVCNQTALEYILSQPSLSAFASIVNTSAQQALLSSYDTDITVFVPASSSFPAAANALGVTADQLSSQRNILSRIVQYHVSSGRALSATDLAARRNLPTESGDLLFVSPGTPLVLEAVGDSAQVTSPDLASGCSWVIHGIDQVLLPVAGTTGINPAFTTMTLTAGR
ncbi:hypothetical protein ACKKBG_A17070 [Auxenochlorella protothecoides x Auxenochlorella symbiontica]|uniref:FAS1 domain-containing protein n=1 Tax=Auxenochlorella protothecoides TaxID=3075 RepID=A0A1D2A127_AUXPR